LPPLAVLTLFLTGDVALTKRADTDGDIRDLGSLIYEFPNAVHDRSREARKQRQERLAWAADAGSDGSWERQPIGRAGDPDVIGAGLKQLTSWARAGDLKTTGVRNGIVETMTAADWARLALVQVQARDGARMMVDVRRVDGGESEWSSVQFLRDSLLEQLKKASLEDVDDRVDAAPSASVQRKRGPRPTYDWAPFAEELKRLGRVRIEDLLQDVDEWCGFTRAFQPLGGYQPRGGDPHRSLLATLIAHGTNLGLAAMSQSVDTLTAEALQDTSRWFLRDSTITAANTILVDYHHGLPLSSLWGAGRRSSSDGQRFAVERDSLLGSVYPRYFGYYDRALQLYTHTSDQHSVYATQAISCAPREAGYVLGGILDNETALAILEHTSDTHGFTEHLFGLCALLGIAFMPRLKDLPDQVLSRLDRDADYGALQPLLRGRINVELILEQWDQLVRLAASLKDRLTPAHVVMQRLANANASDRLAGALTQLGRLMKTIHILRYIQEEKLRDVIQLQLNRGEFRHILAKSLFFANWGSFRSGDYEEVMNKASCLSLLSNAVLVWNTVHIARIVDQLRAAGHEVRDEDLARVSPLMHAHVIPNGSYFQSPRRRVETAPKPVMA
jgi:TnpA family transposase